MRKLLPITIIIFLAVVIVSIISTSTVVSNPFPYKIPVIPNKQSYLTFLVGDSMVAALGANDDGLRQNLIKYYPGHEFVNYNYGFPSTNIESLPDRLEKGVTFDGKDYQSILSQGFDLIILESFAYNPLSQYPLEEGLKKQTEILDQSVRKIISTKPNSVIAIMTPIAPNKELFAKGAFDLSTSQREMWASERVAYIKNAIDFAKSHNIPLINVYEKTLTANGDGDLKYIDSKDHIHPSKEGVLIMNQTIADFIFKNKIFPQ